MKYILLMYGTESLWTNEERRTCFLESMKIRDQLVTNGSYLASSPLQSITTAVTVRVRDGQTEVTDGPFAETHEQLGGYYVLELADLDDAIAVACKLPPVTKGTIEIRPLVSLEGLPPSRPIPAEPSEGSDRPYMLLCYDDEAAWRAAGPDVLRDAMQEAVALASQLDDAGQYLNASPLHSAETATSVRVRNGKRLIIDGPFAETNELLGGYYLILASTPDAAVRVAARHPGARFGSVEVRPLVDVSKLRNDLPVFF